MRTNTSNCKVAVKPCHQAKCEETEPCKPAPMPVVCKDFSMFDVVQMYQMDPRNYFATSSGCTPYLQKENTMQNMDNTETRQRNQMQERVMEVVDKFDTDLRRTFHVTDDERPETAEDFVQRIKDGKFVLRSQNDTWCGAHFMDRVSWRDPAAVADHDGFKAAGKRLEAAREALEDKISFLPVAESYKAFEEFKTMPFVS